MTQRIDAQSTFNKMDAGVIIIDTDKRVISWNKWMIRHSGITSSEALEKPIEELFPEVKTNRIIKGIDSAINKGLSSLIVDRFILRNYFNLYSDRQLTERIHQKILISSLRDNNGDRVCMIYIVDTTVAANREAYFIRQSKELAAEKEKSNKIKKLASIGTMAAGIVHEINNPMTIIKGISSRLLKAGKREEGLDATKVLETGETLNKMVERIYSIIQGLKIISHQAKQEFPEKFSINDIIVEAVNLCETKIKPTNIEVGVQEVPSSWGVYCNPVQISQIIINLLNNSTDEIMSSHENPWLKISCEDHGKDYLIKVTDSGDGLSPEQAEKAFDPFYTNKPVGKGTGLGLPVSKKIAEHHSGDLYVDMNHKNTCFVLKLPKAS